MRPSPVVVLAVLAACGSPPPRPLASRAAAEPTVSAPVDDARCPLRWDELYAPDRIPLQPWSAISTALPDDCPELDAARLLAPGGCIEPACATGVMAPGRRAAFVMDGPGGSGRFAGLGVVIDDPSRGVACITASTVGWRHLHRVADRLAPLPWFADLDGDSRFEVVAWQRLPWGASEAENAMVPIVYALEGNALVRREALEIPLASRVAAAYRELAAISEPPARASSDDDEDQNSEAVDCYAVLVDVLEAWGRHPRPRVTTAAADLER